MPELPDLVYITQHLRTALAGCRVEDVSVPQPVVLRNAVEGTPARILTGRRIAGTGFHGPFIRLTFDADVELVLNLMLAGRIQIQEPGERPPGYRCLSLQLEGGRHVHLCDDQKMMKAYLVPGGSYEAVPGFSRQGMDIMGDSFTSEAFRAIVRGHGRKQVRVLINDHTILSSIGNAYADEILFEAGIHPKTLAARLGPPEVDRLYGAIRWVMAWGIEQVRLAAQPIHIKVRGHMRVRNRHGQACPRCGATIRREGVRGYDVFFCPRCQPPTRRHFIDWETRSGARGESPG